MQRAYSGEQLNRRELKIRLQEQFPQYRVYVRLHKGRIGIGAKAGGLQVTGAALAELMDAATNIWEDMPKWANLTDDGTSHLD